MREIQMYQGPIKKLYVSERNAKKYFKEEVILKGGTFYPNWAGRKISLDYDTYLPDRMEALDLIRDFNCTSVTFVDYHELNKSQKINLKVFRKIKKAYRLKIKEGLKEEKVKRY